MTDAAVPRLLLRTTAGQAAVTKLWIEGTVQRRIAQAFGYKGPAPVCGAIAEFIVKYCPEVGSEEGTQYRYPKWPGYNNRPELARLALQRYDEGRRK